MPSKSNAVDKTSPTTKTNVVDRRAVQQSGIQLLDSVVNSSDSKVIAAALGEVRAMLNNMSSANSVTVQTLLKSVDTVAGMVNKGQVQMSQFALQTMENARRELQMMADQGHMVLELADETVGRAMSMAERVAVDQARNQAQALEIVADAKTGDYADTLKTLSGMVMGFALLALVIVKGK